MMSVSHAVFESHTVFNQSPPLLDYNAFECDQPLQALLPEALDSSALDRLTTLGAAVGDPLWIDHGFKANEQPPVLRNFDRYGQRSDRVEFHPAYHELMALGMTHGVHSVAWKSATAGHLVHAALQYLLTQVEPGVCCPLAMTSAAVPVLRKHQEVGGKLQEKVLVDEYDQRFLAIDRKRSATVGMAMTEKQGGSDVRANTTTASVVSESTSGGEYRLRGHKWFCSAPMSDAFLTLAQADQGLTCFLVPRICPDGSCNRIFLQRLKHKLGNHANASAEIEYHDTWAMRLGEEGAGVNTIIDMVQHTRLDTAAAPAGMMRQALVQAIHHARHRQAFGQPLIAQPLMRAVLADLALESEASTLLVMRLAAALDAAGESEQERHLARLLTIVAKFWINKQAPQFIYEAMECLGGNGYVEESILPRLYREAPVNSIWEGSGNVMCLDFLRVLERAPQCLDAYDEVVSTACDAAPRLKACRAQLMREIGLCRAAPGTARRVLEMLARLLQAVLLQHHAPTAVFDAFVQSRLGDRPMRSYGTATVGDAAGGILARAWQEE